MWNLFREWVLNNYHLLTLDPNLYSAASKSENFFEEKKGLL